jgi:DNA-binding CsgD family transcriptional regulator
MPTEPFSLTDAEAQILRLLARGSTSRFIAERLVLSRETVRVESAPRPP